MCQTYPSLGDGELVRLRDDVLCPTGAWKLSQMPLGAWRQRIADFTWHHDLYEAAVGCWNVRVEAADAGTQFSVLHYYDFLLNLYGRFDAVDSQLPGPQRRQIMDSWHEHRREHGNGLLSETSDGAPQ